MLKRYDVVIGGNRTTVQLSDADATSRGLISDPIEPVEAAKGRTPANKSRRPANKSSAKG